jgi:hypothetical protein
VHEINVTAFRPRTDLQPWPHRPFYLTVKSDLTLALLPGTLVRADGDALSSLDYVML